MARLGFFVRSLVLVLFALVASGVGLFLDFFRRTVFVSARRVQAKALASFLALLSLLFVGSTAHAQFSVVKAGSLVHSHATVGTTTADAISDGSVSNALIGWKLCNDAINTSTYLLVGKAADAATDGLMLGPGKCFVCDACNKATLQAIRVKAQAASNGYSITQFKQ